MDGPAETPVVMPFGKYKGRVVNDIPQNYLEWFADNVKTTPVLAAAVAKALGRTGPVGAGASSKAGPSSQMGSGSKSKSVPSLELTGSKYVPSGEGGCPFDCE
jgi:hypothetical protein